MTRLGRQTLHSLGDCEYNLQIALGQRDIPISAAFKTIQEETPMSAPSRRPEIRRRRTRKEKLLKLRKRLAATTADGERKRLEQKLHRLSLVSPANPAAKTA